MMMMIIWKNELKYLLGFFSLWQMQVHLVAVEIRVVRRAAAFIEAKGAPWKYLDAMRHDTHFM